MTFLQITASVVAVALTIGCGKVRDDTGDTSHPEGNGGNGSKDDGGVSGGGAESGGQGGAGSSGSGGKSGGGAGSGSGGTGGGGTGSGGATSSGGQTTTGGATSTGGALNTGGAVAEEEGTKAMRAGPTVWIGEVETVVTYPEVMTDDTNPQKAVLILDRVATGVTGTITFGSGPPPPAPTDPARTWPPGGPGGEEYGYDSNWSFSPHTGFVYSIVSSELRGNTLVLSFVPLELFEEWCGLQTTNPGDRYLDEPCDCDAGECHAASGPTRRIELVVSGSALSGQLSRPPGNYLGETPAMKLARVK